MDFSKRHTYLVLIKYIYVFLIVSIIGRGLWLNYFKRPIVNNDQLVFEINEVSKNAGIEEVHTIWTSDDKRIENILPWMTAVGASASVVDINNDGWQDIYFVSNAYKGRNKLFVNQQNGTFIEKSSDYGLDLVNEDGITTRAIFFDANNDGFKEMLQLTNSCPKIYKLGGDNKYLGSELSNSKNGCFTSFALNIIDYDGDGLLDIIYAGLLLYEDGAGGLLPDNLVMAQNGAPTIFLRNLGNLNFKEERIIERQDMRLFGLAIGSGDLRGEFKQDLWFATDYHHDQVFLKENGKYSYDENSINHSLSKSGMNSDLGYIDHKLAPYNFVSHIYKQGFQPGGNSLYHYDGQKFVDYSDDFGVKDCGWAWGAKFLDIQNDGELDLYVANGYISAKKSRANAKSKDFWFKHVTSFVGNPFATKVISWRPSLSGFSFSGNQKDCLFINKDGKFSDVSTHNKLKIDQDNLDGRSVNLVDFMNDGSQGILVANQKGRPYLYRVVQKNKNHWLGIKLVGTKSNRDAIGTKVLLYRNGLPLLIRENQPYNGFSAQSDDRLHFGLGEYSGEVLLKIHWPSGKVQKKSVRSIDQYIEMIEE